jgi:hypothetical protein
MLERSGILTYMPPTRSTASGDDWGKWITLAASLVALGVRPGKWGKPIAIAGIIAALLGILKD